MFANWLNKANEKFQLTDTWNNAVRSLTNELNAKSGTQEIVNSNFIEEELKKEQTKESDGGGNPFESPGKSVPGLGRQKQFESPLDKQSQLTFLQYLEQNQSQTFIQTLIENYQKDHQSQQVNFGKRSTSIKDEVLEIVEDLENKQDILQNIDPIYQQEIEPDEMLVFEIQKLQLPIDLPELMEKCEDLGRILKVVNLLLAFNVMKHQDEFVEGVDRVDSIYDDLKIVKENAGNSRASVQFLQEKMIYQTAKIMLLKRKQQRLKKVKLLTQLLISVYLKQEQKVYKLIGKYEFSEAYKLIQTSLQEISQNTKEHSLKALSILKTKFDQLLGILREQITVTVMKQGVRFERFFFERVVQGFQAGAFDTLIQSQAMLKGQQGNKSIFIHHLKDGLRQQAIVEIKKSIFKFIQNPSKLKEIGIDSENPQIKMASLQKMIQKGSLLPVLKDIYQSLASMIQNQHQITKYLLIESQDFAGNENIKNELIQDRVDFWNYLQEKLVQFLQSTYTDILDFTTMELFNFLVLANIIMEVGTDFSGSKQCVLLDFIQENILARYLDKFKEEMGNNVKNLLESEDWNRLPLPDSFSIKELTDPFLASNNWQQTSALSSGISMKKEESFSIFPRNYRSMIQKFISVDPGDNKENMEEQSLKKNYTISSNQVIITYELREVPSELNRNFSSKEEFLYFSEQNFKPLSKNFSKMSLSDESDEEECYDIGEEQDLKTNQIIANYSGLGTLDGASKQLTQYQQLNTINMNKDLILSQSALNFIKGNFCKHVQLMSLGSAMAFDVFISLTQICELYAFSVFYTFADSQQFKRLFDESIFEQNLSIIKNAKDLLKVSDSHEIHIFQNRYKSLQNNLVRIKGFIENNLIDGKNEDQVLKKHILTNPALIFLTRFLPNSIILELFSQDIPERDLILMTIVALESVQLITKTLNEVKEQIKEQLNIQQQSYLLQFFKGFNTMTEQMHRFLMTQVVNKLVEIEESSLSMNKNLVEVIQNIQFINWNLKQKKNEISTFTEKILSSFQLFKSNLNVTKQGEKEFALPSRIQQELQTAFVDQVCLELLDSITKIKKQNEFGREALKADLNYLRSAFEGEIKSNLPCFDLVLEYLDAHALGKDDLLQFIKNSDLKYTYRQILNLIEMAPGVQSLKSQEKKEFNINVEVFYKDYFSTFMIAKSSHAI